MNTRKLQTRHMPALGSANPQDRISEVEVLTFMWRVKGAKLKLVGKVASKNYNYNSKTTKKTSNLHIIVSAFAT